MQHTVAWLQWLPQLHLCTFCKGQNDIEICFILYWVSCQRVVPRIVDQLVTLRTCEPAAALIYWRWVHTWRKPLLPASGEPHYTLLRMGTCYCTHV
jgi:hypothetical protein